MGNFKNELNGYNCLPRKLIFDSELSDRARFLYCYMAAKPEGWNFYVKHMLAELGYSKDTLYKYIDELIERGWLVRVNQVRDNGRFGSTIYTLKAEAQMPCPKNSDTEEHRVLNLPTPNFTDTEKLGHRDKREYIHKRENIKREKETNKENDVFELFCAFCKKYRKYGGRVRSMKTEFENFKKKHKDWKEIIPMLDYALEKENEEREQATMRGDFFPVMKNLQTYINQRSWEVYSEGFEEYDPNEYHPADLKYDPKYNAYRFYGISPQLNLYDGYTDEDRPNGARVVEQFNVYEWRSDIKDWERVS